MKTNNKYLDFYELMNEKLLKQEQKVISCLALLLAMKNELRFKDSMDSEERFEENAFTRISDAQSILYPLLDSLKNYDVLEEILLSSELFTEPLANDIITVYHYREENRNTRLPLFDYSSSDKLTFQENSLLFLQRLVAISRIRCYLEEIISGMENYGVDSYFVVEDGDEADMLLTKEGVFLSPEEMDEEACVKELLVEMMPQDEDSDEERDDKMQILSLISQIGKYRGKSK